MFRYSAFSLTIDSELELPELALGHGDPDVVIRFGSVSRQRQLATIEDEVAFPGHLGWFRFQGGREIVVDPLPEADPRELQIWLQGKVMAYLLRQRGCLPLHASGISIEGQGVLFVGESGAGKSTTAAAFYARGHKVLADDVAAIRAAGRDVGLWTAWPALRLLEDARQLIRTCASDFQGKKHVFRLEIPQPAVLVSVKRIYFLEYGADHESPVRAHTVVRSSAVALLNTNSFLNPLRTGSDLLRINLDRSASIAALLPVHRLTRPRSLSSLPEVVDFVEKDLNSSE